VWRLALITFCCSVNLVSAAALAADPVPADGKKQLKLTPADQTSPEPAALNKKTQPQIAVYKSVQQDGTALFSDRVPLNRPYQLVRYDCFACDPQSTVNWHTTPLYIRPYNQLISKAASEYQLDPALIRAIIHAESSFRPAVISQKGAIGLMQLMPATAAHLGVIDASSPAQNIAGGSRYLADLLKQYNGEVNLALAAYNAGASNVKRYNGVPPFAETQAYVQRVAILRKRYQQAG
jgi:soluble lytic murein transglycosylase-like protein